MKNILVAVDFSDVTDAVIEATCELAALSNARVRLVHAVAHEFAYVGYGAIPGQDVVFTPEDMEADQTKLTALVDRLTERGVDAMSALVEGPIADTLLEEIENNAIDLVIVGSHGHGALFNLVAGSVTQALLHKAKVPVLVVPSRPKK